MSRTGSTILFVVSIVTSLAVGYIVGREVTAYRTRSIVLAMHQQYLDGMSKAYPLNPTP